MSSPSPLPSGTDAIASPRTAPIRTHPGDDQCPGARRTFAAQDGRIARVRLAGAPMTPAQVRGLADIAERLGDGTVWFTTRSNVQVRGLDDAGAAAFPEELAALGLFPSPSHDRVRNIVVAPFADDRLLALAAALDAAVCARPELAELSGRFLVGIDDGAGELLALPLDLSLQASGDDLVLSLGSDPRGYDLGAVDDPARAARLVTDVAAAFLALAREEDSWNVDDLSVDATDELHAVVEGLLPAAGSPTVVRRQPRLAGVVDGGGRSWVAALAPLATVSATGWRELADVAERLGGDVRVTPWHTMLVPVPEGTDPHGPDVTALLARLAATGWVVSDGSPWLDVHGCSGERHCRRSLSDVQGHARDLVAARTDAAPLRRPVMIVGCERRCGHPSVDHLSVVATSATTYEVGEHDGTHAPQPAPFTRVTPADLAGVVARHAARGARA